MSELDKKLEKLKTGTETKKHGGARPSSGRKPKEVNMISRGIAKYLDDHFNGNVEIEVIDPKTNKTVTIKQPRVVAVLEKLYSIGMRAEGNPDALNKWLDRARGKAVQPIVGKDEDGNDGPILIKLDI